MSNRSTSIPARAELVVLGSGPMGIEAALAARAHGFDAIVLEAGEVADSVRQWGHVRLFTPWTMMVTDRGLRALAAAQEKDPTFFPERVTPERIADPTPPTGEEFASEYLLPLSSTPPLRGRVHAHTRAVAVTRSDRLKGDLIADPQRGDHSFRILWRASDGSEAEGIIECDIVIDATGVYRTPAHYGVGGIPPVGGDRVPTERGIPDVTGADRERTSIAFSPSDPTTTGS